MTPQTARMLRARQKPRKLKQEHRKHIIGAIARVMREDLANGITPTLLSHEATIRASLRSGLCLEAWPWREADAEACAVLDEVFKAVGAKRPTWMQGQPEYTDGGAISHDRVRCAQCERPLDIENKIFCSRRCYDSFHTARRYRDDREAALLAKRLYWARWRERQDPRTCEVCRDEFQPKTPKQRLCSVRCGLAKARGMARRGR